MVLVKISLQLGMTAILFCLTMFGNGGIGVLMQRFKSLRTVPNILLLNSCIVDILHVFFNTPGFIVAYIWRIEDTFAGRPLALALSTVHVLFSILNLFSLTLMMLDRLFAIRWGLSYGAWKSRGKAFKAIAALWTSCLVISSLALIPIWDIELGDAPVFVYRPIYFAVRGRYITLIIFPFVILINLVVAIVTCSSIKDVGKINSKKEFKQAYLLDAARKRNEAAAVKTIGLTVILYFVCYMPSIIYTVWNKAQGIAVETEASWFGFIAFYSLFISSGFNPIIYAARTARLRSAVRQYLKDPCGNTDIPRSTMVSHYRRPTRVAIVGVVNSASC